MTSDLYSEQETIEQQCRADTQLRFQNELTKKIQKADEASTFYGTSLLKRAIEPMADVITANRKAVKKGKAMNAGQILTCWSEKPATNAQGLPCSLCSIRDSLMPKDTL